MATKEELKKFRTEALVAELDRRGANPLTEFRRAGGRTKGAAKARSSEQARAAVMARWSKGREEEERWAKEAAARTRVERAAQRKALKLAKKSSAK